MCTTLGVRENTAEPLPVSLSSFLIYSICISFSLRCNIQNKPAVHKPSAVTYRNVHVVNTVSIRL